MLGHIVTKNYSLSSVPLANLFLEIILARFSLEQMIPKCDPKESSELGISGTHFPLASSLEAFDNTGEVDQPKMTLRRISWHFYFHILLYFYGLALIAHYISKLDSGPVVFTFYLV